MRNFSLVALCLLLSACSTVDSSIPTSDEVRTSNRSKLVNLQPGMTRAEVLSAMGTTTIRVRGSSIADINNPYRTEMYNAGESRVEILYYYTDIKQRDDAITDDELTPLVLRNGKLDGWGWSYLNDLAAKYDIRLR